MIQLEGIVNEFVSYEIFIFPTEDKEKPDCIDIDTSAKTIATCICDYANDLARDYFWYIDDFQLNLSKFSQGDNIYVLKGKTVFGDCLDDEWFITYMLFQISRKFPQVIIRTWDFDGEFLLIESAEYLPDWLEPETSSNRIFIHSGNLVIISNKDLEKPSIQSALDFVKNRSHLAIACADIQESIKERTKEFENGQKLHFVRVTIPRKLAIALQNNPRIVTFIIRSFIHRDPSDMTKISSLRKLRDENGSIGFVFVKVHFTRMQFAQLLCQNVEAPKDYPMPSKNSEEYVASSTGLKMALGAELSILLNDKNGNALLNLLGLDGDIIEYNGPDGDYSWLEVDDGVVMNNIEEKMKSFQLNKDEEDSVVEAMLREDDLNDDASDNDSPILRQLNQFIKSSSAYDGVNLNKSTYNDQSDLEDAFPSSDSEESNEDFLEQEIMEAIMFDPDLMMKILERGELLGLDTTGILEKMTAQDENFLSADKPTIRQKGLADIDKVKLSAAKLRTRKQSHFGPDKEPDLKDASDVHTENSNISTSEEDSYIYDEIHPPIPTTPIENNLSNSALEADIADMEAYFNSMDSELKKLDADRPLESEVENLQEALKSGFGPAHTLFTSLK